MKCSPEQLSYQRSYDASHRHERHAYYEAHRGERLDYERAYHADHREERRERKTRQRAWFTANLRILRAAQGCDDCGTSEGLLEHHHLDPDTKTYSVSRMYGHSLKAFVDEIAKCVVLCRPCHGQRHAEMRTLAA